MNEIKSEKSEFSIYIIKHVCVDSFVVSVFADISIEFNKSQQQSVDEMQPVLFRTKPSDFVV